MKSKNFSLALWVGYYLTWLVVYRSVGASWLGSEAAFLGFSALILPILLALHRHIPAALMLLGVTALFSSTLLFMQTGSFTYRALLELYNHPPIAVFAFLGFVGPGLFLVTQLDAEALPHELARWGHAGLLQPLIVVITARERAKLRLASIEEVTCARGIELTTKFQHLRRPFLWLVPLANAMISEAAYAGRYRMMLDCGDRFVPTRLKQLTISPMQTGFAASLVVLVLLGAVLEMVR